MTCMKVLYQPGEVDWRELAVASMLQFYFQHQCVTALSDQHEPLGELVAGHGSHLVC